MLNYVHYWTRNNTNTSAGTWNSVPVPTVILLLCSFKIPHRANMLSLSVCLLVCMYVCVSAPLVVIVGYKIMWKTKWTGHRSYHDTSVLQRQFCLAGKPTEQLLSSLAVFLALGRFRLLSEVETSGSVELRCWLPGFRAFGNTSMSCVKLMFSPRCAVRYQHLSLLDLTWIETQ